MTAVDAVDQESMPGLTVGAMVAITYPPDAPRQARLNTHASGMRGTAD